MRRVSISSIINGFEPTRATAKAGIELMGHIPVMSESFGARTYSARQACLTEIERSDVFLVILGSEFGFETDDGRSVTQAEFQYARAIGTPILAFVQDIPMGGKQAEFRREVENFESGFFRATFSTPEQLKDEVVRGLRQLEEFGRAWPEARFLERLAKEEFQRQGLGSRGACLSIALLPQPAVSVHLPDVERRADALFTQLGNAGLASLRDGYELMEAANWTSIRSRESELKIFEGGLRLVLLRPNAPKREGSSFDEMFVPPSRLRSLAVAAFELFGTNSGWCQLRLQGMQYHSVRELPAQGATSVSISMYGDDVAQEQKLFQPLTQSAYDKWVDQVVERFERRFRG